MRTSPARPSGRPTARPYLTASDLSFSAFLMVAVGLLFLFASVATPAVVADAVSARRSVPVPVPVPADAKADRSASYGLLDVSTASASRLAMVEGLSAADGSLIVAFRDAEHGGSFDRAEDAAEPLARAHGEAEAERLAWRLALSQDGIRCPVCERPLFDRGARLDGAVCLCPLPEE